MLRLTQGQRDLLAEKLCDAGNVGAGALVFGQLLADKFSELLAVLGLVIWVVFGVCAVLLMKEKKR